VKMSSLAPRSSRSVSTSLRRLSRAAHNAVTRMSGSIGDGLLTSTPLTSSTSTTAVRPLIAARCRSLAACVSEASTSGARRSNSRSGASSPRCARVSDQIARLYRTQVPCDWTRIDAAWSAVFTSAIARLRTGAYIAFGAAGSGTAHSRAALKCSSHFSASPGVNGNRSWRCFRGKYAVSL
jgi:hypothetical protein